MTIVHALLRIFAMGKNDVIRVSPSHNYHK